MRPWALALAVLLLLPGAASAGRGPVVSIIIDDLGDRLAAGQRTVALPGPVACSVLPHTPYAIALADAARAAGKEVMLHLPMESVGRHRTGPGGLTAAMSQAEFLRTVEADLNAVPHLVGVNNHMGSLVTSNATQMGWLMHTLKAHGGLFFVDSRTTAATVAEQAARAEGLPTLRRHVFLDNDPSPAAIAAEFDRLIKLARKQGAAVAIGHPLPATLALLEARLPRLKEQGVELIPLSEMIALEKEPNAWQASWSR